jgi:hypothetical protein
MKTIFVALFATMIASTAVAETVFLTTICDQVYNDCTGGLPVFSEVEAPAGK